MHFLNFTANLATTENLKHGQTNLYHRNESLTGTHKNHQDLQTLSDTLDCQLDYSLTIHSQLLQCEAPKIAQLVYNSNNYGLWYL